ncbi:MAG: glycosyl hydrolase, partial [Gammaproteobacteria bacterium]|nr:glycosyl hydrolase [Gemmatimonadota bacterium]NIU77327.1 glycosyl hydrolase [Gammaproteobacteria bacterium]NIX23002.1 glycosyl hydrolase [Actinomycetota bacterium]
DAGATWESEGTPVESFLEGAWVLDADHAWAVGHEGTILFRASE